MNVLSFFTKVFNKLLTEWKYDRREGTELLEIKSSYDPSYSFVLLIIVGSLTFPQKRKRQ